MGLFTPALEEMRRSGSAYRQPESFRDYLAQHRLDIPPTIARYISVDYWEALDKDLRAANTMVFRLGNGGTDSGTSFALAATSSAGMREFFLYDDDLFNNAEPELFLPKIDMRSLFAFSLLPSFSETSLVSLAAYCGALAHALGLDEGTPISAPATGQSTYTFSFKPTLAAANSWNHTNGQVEVDSLLTGQRNGKTVAIIVESKCGPKKTLAKHKLLYPYLALRPSIPRYVPVMLVYLKAFRKEDGFHFYTAKFETSGREDSVIGGNLFSEAVASHLIVPLQSMIGRGVDRYGANARI